MKEYRFNNATIRVYGNAYHVTIKDATITFLKKVELSKTKRREQNENGNIDKSRVI